MSREAPIEGAKSAAENKVGEEAAKKVNKNCSSPTRSRDTRTERDMLHGGTNGADSLPTAGSGARKCGGKITHKGAQRSEPGDAQLSPSVVEARKGSQYSQAASCSVIKDSQRQSGRTSAVRRADGISEKGTKHVLLRGLPAEAVAWNTRNARDCQCARKIFWRKASAKCVPQSRETDESSERGDSLSTGDTRVAERVAQKRKI